MTPYQCLARKVKGETHRRNLLPNQDNWKIKELDGITILAVADGHGSAKCRYSQNGSRIAVKVFCSKLSSLFKEKSRDCELLFQELSKLRHERLPSIIVNDWRDHVQKDFQRREPDNIEKVDPESIYQFYGTTLLGLVFTNNYYFALQIGDGDILRVFSDASVERIISYEKILGVETKSLSNANAWSYFDSQLIKPDSIEEMPVLFLLSTDGLANSFIDDQAFLQIGSDYLNWIKRDEFVFVKRKVKEVLRNTSKQGSGDDITLALAVNLKRIEEDTVNDFSD